MIFFTSILSNYLDKSLVLAESVLRHHPDSEFRIYIFDYDTAQLPTQDELRSHLEVDILSSLPTFHSSRKTYPDLLLFESRFNIVECCTAVKPFIFLELLKLTGKVIYLDPDTVVYKELDLLKEDLKQPEWDLQIIPHVINPPSQDSLLSERLFANFGVFNLGYLAARQSIKSVEFLKWWATTCAIYGVARPIAGLYVDQKPFDFAPAFIDKLSIIRHPGWNVAWWNLFCDGRTLRPNHKIEMNGSYHEIVFMHFSNLDRDFPEAFVSRPLKNLLKRKNHGRAKLAANTVFLELLNAYRERCSWLASNLLQTSPLKVIPSKRLSLSQQLLDESFRFAAQSSSLSKWIAQAKGIKKCSNDTEKLFFAMRMILIFSDTKPTSLLKLTRRAIGHFRQTLINSSLWDFSHQEVELISNELFR